MLCCSAEKLTGTAPESSLYGESGRSEPPATSALQLSKLPRSQEHPRFPDLHATMLW